TRLERIPEVLKRFRQSVLAAAVSGKLTEQWRGESDYKTELGTEVPINWDVKVASEVCEKVQSGSTPRDNPFEQGGKVPFLKVYNIVNQKVDFDYRPQFVTEEVHSKKLKRSIALPGDVLMNIVGPPLGKVAILNDQYPEWNLNQAITLFRANELKLNKQYLYFVLCEGDLVRKVMPSTKGSVGQVNISLTQCRESTIPLPSIEEQTEIVRLVEQYFALADTLEKNVVNAKQRVDNLTQSILAKAFKGQLVPQDPNDEPADKLLERIKAAREEADKLEKAAKKAAKASKAKK
ncbi:MAG: restriction endonuclease subunit S, partial [Marinomonas sp.]